MGMSQTFSTAEAQRLYRSGLSLRAVARELGVTMQSVQRRLVNTGETMRSASDQTGKFNWPIDAVDEMRRLYLDEDMSAAQIAAHFNRTRGVSLTRNAVIGKLHKLKISRPPVVAQPAPPKGPPPSFSRGFKRPKLKLIIGGNGAVLRVPEAPAPKFAPPRLVDASVSINPRPWVTRRDGHECAWPIAGEGADTISCCNPTGGANYCRTHALIMTGSMPASWAGFSQPAFAKAMAR